MSEDNQTVIPPSFVNLYLLPGRQRPSAPRAEIAQRHEFCDDLAQMLTEPAREKHWALGVDEAEILRRMHSGLTSAEVPVVSPAEAQWVVSRLAELLDWPMPVFDTSAGPRGAHEADT
jgi:hypothetical protein